MHASAPQEPASPAAVPTGLTKVFPRSDWRILAAVLAALAGYLALYYLSPLRSTGGLWRRVDILTFRLLLPDQFVPDWFGYPPEFAILDRLPLLAVAAGILLFAALAGRLLLAACRIGRGMTDVELVVFSSAVGLNALSLYVLVIGLAGWLTSSYVLAVPAAIVLLAAAGRALCKRRSPTLAATPAKESPRLLSGRWLWLAAPFVLATLLASMLPPVDPVVREHHLLAPKEFFLAGEIRFLPHNVHANVPLGSEMVSLLAMMLLNDWWLGALVGKTVIAATAPLTALALWSAGRRFVSSTAGIVSALVYISIPWIDQVASHGRTEAVSAFYLFLAIYAVLLWQSRPSQSTAWPAAAALAGFLSGAAIATRYAAALLVALPLATWIFLAGRRLNWKPAAVFCLAAFGGCGLWLVKSWLFTGNPAYPLFYEWFGGITRDADKNAQWMAFNVPRGFSLGDLAGDLAHLGWRSDWLSPLLLPLGLLACFVPSHRKLALALWAVVAYTVSVWWLLTPRVEATWIPALPVLALLAGLGSTWAASLAWSRIMKGLLVGTLACNLLFILSGARGNNPYFASLAQLRHSPLRADRGHLLINSRVPPGCCVLAVGEAQVFDLEADVLYNTMFDDSVFDGLYRGRSHEEFRAELLAKRISHVYVNWNQVRISQAVGQHACPGYICRDLFANLVSSGIFDPPLEIDLHPGQLYRVRLTKGGAAGQAEPLVVPATARDP